MKKYRFQNDEGDLYSVRAADYTAAKLKAESMLGGNVEPADEHTQAAAKVEHPIATGQLFSFN